MITNLIYEQKTDTIVARVRPTVSTMLDEMAEADGLTRSAMMEKIIIERHLENAEGQEEKQ
jgi:hypothetical protein